MLTERQSEVLELRKSGNSITYIAKELEISESAVWYAIMKAEERLELERYYPKLTSLKTGHLNALKRQGITQDMLERIVSSTPEKIYLINGIGENAAKKIFKAFNCDPPNGDIVRIDFLPDEISYIWRVLNHYIKSPDKDTRSPELAHRVFKKIGFYEGSRS